MRIALTINGKAVTAEVERARASRTTCAKARTSRERISAASTASAARAPSRSTARRRARASRSPWRAKGSSVRTIEGFDDDPVMERLRQAFTAEHALQCGYCTPGMLMTCARYRHAPPRRRRSAHPPRALWQSVPLHRLRRDRERHPGRAEKSRLVRCEVLPHRGQLRSPDSVPRHFDELRVVHPRLVAVAGLRGGLCGAVEAAVAVRLAGLRLLVRRRARRRDGSPPSACRRRARARAACARGERDFSFASSMSAAARIRSRPAARLPFANSTQPCVVRRCTSVSVIQ
jgi:aerobic-type carbon monoxide dehydrogenase small subunit (CoxS/CutS family)